MSELVLYCKSYEGDVLRAVRLSRSIERHNRDGLRCFISVPHRDRALFQARLGNTDLELIDDEEIVRMNPRVDPGLYTDWDGRLSQQVIKSEFWRLVPCDAYVCIDSDAVFLRDFQGADFLHPDGSPYTVMHQQKELLQLAANLGKVDVLENYRTDASRVREQFSRLGMDYDFGPSPLIWSPRVWQVLDQRILEPAGMNLWDAIKRFPAEIRWYGETLLSYRSIPLYPIEPLMRVYHYDWQWKAYHRQGETPETVAANFLGAVYQSNWQFELDFGAKKRPWSSRLARRIKRGLR